MPASDSGMRVSRVRSTGWRRRGRRRRRRSAARPRGRRRGRARCGLGPHRSAAPGDEGSADVVVRRGRRADGIRDARRRRAPPRPDREHGRDVERRAVVCPAGNAPDRGDVPAAGGRGGPRRRRPTCVGSSPRSGAPRPPTGELLRRDDIPHALPAQPAPLRVIEPGAPRRRRVRRRRPSRHGVDPGCAGLGRPRRPRGARRPALNRVSLRVRARGAASFRRSTRPADGRSARGSSTARASGCCWAASALPRRTGQSPIRRRSGTAVTLLTV